MTGLVLAILMQAPMKPKFPEPIKPMPIERFMLKGEEGRVEDPVYYQIIF
jgi:hypothetical protein